MRGLRDFAVLSAIAFLIQQTPAGQVSPSPGQTATPASPPARDAALRTAGTGRVRGRVFVDGSEPPAPIMGARISISAGTATIEPVFTDAAGQFEITALATARYTLTAEKTGFAKTRYGAKNELEATFPVDVANGTIVNDIEIRMPRGAAITGRIIDELGDPVVGALVTVGYVQIAGRDTSLVAVSSRLGWTTDDRGEYRIGGLAAGRYVVLVYGALEGSSTSGPPEWSQTIAWVKTYYPDASSPAAATPIALRAGEERAGVDFTLGPSRPAKLTLSLTDPSGTPISGVILLTNPALSGVSTSTAALSPTNPRATLTLQPGDWSATVIGVSGGGRALAHLTLGSGDEIALPLVAATGARISGRVVFSGSTAPPPATSVGLRVRGVGADARTPFSNALTSVKADGTFEMNGLIGTFVLQPASPIPGWTLQALRAGSRDLLDEPLALTGVERISDIEVVFTDQPGELSGTTVDGQGRPSPGCTVVVIPDKGDLRADSDRARLQRSNQNGRFVVSGVRPGNYLAAAIANIDASAWLSPDYRERLRPAALSVALAEREKATATLVCSSLP